MGTSYLQPTDHFGFPCRAIIEGEDGKRKRCNRMDNDKPMAFRKLPWCSDNHRRLVTGKDDV